MSYQTDRAWGDSLLWQAVLLIAPHIIVPADARRDMLEATDLVVLDTAKGGIAFRTRRDGHGNSTRWGHQFTLRYARPSGAATEFGKIMAGYADWMFYGWASDSRFTRWMLLDLSVFREVVADFPTTGQEYPNADGTTFRAYSIFEFPQSLIIDQFEVPRALAA